METYIEAMQHRATGGWFSLLEQGIWEFHQMLETSGNRFSTYLQPEWLVENVKAGYLGYVVSGLALKKIFEFKFWEKLGFDSVKDFCQRSLGRSVWYCKQTIKAAEVVVNLICENVRVDLLPQCQSQCVPLFALLDEGQEAIAAKWEEVLEYVEESGSPLTAAVVDRVVNPDKPERAKPHQIRVNPEKWKRIEAMAQQRGISPEQWLDELIDDRLEEDAIAEPDPQKVEEWEEDLEELCEEQERSQSEPPAEPMKFTNPRKRSARSAHHPQRNRRRNTLSSWLRNATERDATERGRSG